MTRVRAALALGALVAVLGGMPWLLARFGEWPISGWPTERQLRDLDEAVVSDTAVFGVLTLAAWAVWLLFVVSFLVETRATLRGLQAPSIALAGPVQRAARLLVATVVIGVTLQQSAAPVVSLPLTSARVAAATSPEPSGSAPTSPPVSSNPSSQATDAPASMPGVVTVAPGDSAWSLAETHLGDGMRWRELWETNRRTVQPDGRTWTDPQIIRVGWRLAVPLSPERPGSVSGGTSYLVERGDTLSGIAAEKLGDPLRYLEIFDLNVGAVQPDGHRLEDPDLILPGWELDVVDEAFVGVPTDVVADAGEAEPEATPPASSDPATSPTSRPSAAPPPASPLTSVPPRATDEPTAPAPADDGSSGGDTSSSGWSGPTSALAGVTGALAAGLAVRVTMLRRRQSVRGARSQLPLAGTLAETDAAIVAASDVPLVRWAGQQLARLTVLLDRRDVTAGPVAVELSEVSGIEVLWEMPQPVAPSPWRSADGGWAWRLPYDPDAEVPVADLPCSIPALVTIGERDGRHLLLDLEAYGSLTVGGPADSVDRFLRSVAIELSSNDDLADANVLTTSLDTGVDHLERLTLTSADDAAVALERAVGSVQSALDGAQVSSTFAARTGSAVPIETTVAVVGTDDPAKIARLVEICQARRAVAIVAAGTEGMAQAHIEIGADGVAHLTPLGIRFSPTGVASETACALDDLLAAFAVEQSPMPDRVEDVRVSAMPDASAPSRDDLALPAERDDPQLLVRVLGAPAVPDRPGLGRRELILTVYLACREGPVAASAVQDALWGGKPVETKTVWNVIGATRRALGDLDDGTPVLPAADRSRGGTLQLAPAVSTDLALLRSRVARATAASSTEAIDLLRDALTLVTGPPFDAIGYDWAHRDQDVAEASTLIEQATEDLVALALDAGQVDVAREAIVRGLRGLPGNEVLYRCRMRVEHHAGNLAGVTAAYEELVTYLNDLETEPSPATSALFHDLVRPAGRR